MSWSNQKSKYLSKEAKALFNPEIFMKQLLLTVGLPAEPKQYQKLQVPFLPLLAQKFKINENTSNQLEIVNKQLSKHLTNCENL